MDERMISVAIAPAGPAVAGLQRERYIALPFDLVLARLKEAITDAGLWLLHEIDPQSLLRRSGFAIPAARQILFFHPRLMVRLLKGDGAAILEAPLKFALLEDERGTHLRWLDPIATFARYHNPQLADLGSMLAMECERIADRVAESNAVSAGSIEASALRDFIGTLEEATTRVPDLHH